MTATHLPAKASIAARTRQYILLASLFVIPQDRRARVLQHMDGRYNLFGEEGLNHNMGYWAGDPDSLDEASDALARLLADVGGLRDGARLLDVGCGFGDQDMLWAQEYDLAELVAIDIVEFKVELARQRARAAGLDRVRFDTGTGCRLRYPDSSFDHVFAIESSFHIRTRAAFFAEAFRVLRPGGRLALAEPAPARGVRLSRMAVLMQQTVVATPRENIYDADGYRRELQRAGFTGIEIRSIKDQAFTPFMRYLRRRLTDPVVVGRVNPMVRAMWKGWAEQADGQSGMAGEQDYLLVTASRPGS
ncbi:class I SAM-dependent methyltransferase [Saccharopolyspora cebuensis]|uniref:SAM-dependent methyltransferase n=1 Tax=Saccharopolyspora cebuensis TaxID=418759 RepID=UPI0031ED706A